MPLVYPIGSVPGTVLAERAWGNDNDGEFRDVSGNSECLIQKIVHLVHNYKCGDLRVFYIARFDLYRVVLNEGVFIVALGDKIARLDGHVPTSMSIIPMDRISVETIKDTRDKWASSLLRSKCSCAECEMCREMHRQIDSHQVACARCPVSINFCRNNRSISPLFCDALYLNATSRGLYETTDIIRWEKTVEKFLWWLEIELDSRKTGGVS